MLMSHCCLLIEAHYSDSQETITLPAETGYHSATAEGWKEKIPLAAFDKKNVLTL